MAKIHEAKGGLADRSFMDFIEKIINLIINHLQKDFL